MQRFSVVALALLAAGVAYAQAEKPRVPTDPQVRVPPVQYRSVFADYETFREPELAKWRDANDEVKAAAAKKPAAERR
jgi:hypothetical protein